ncbi:MAG TPA: AMP-binding protein, partial [Thermodesulfobacteriota bacterium]|nr:AMP-binding protein [Thermodesulfobacteriota bacterium]
MAQRLKRPSLDYPEKPVSWLLQRAAERFPKKTAVIDPHGRRDLTFQELDRESDALALNFTRWGIGKGDRISFFLSNGWEYFVGFYAAMKAGAVVSPMNPTLRDRELRNQVNDSDSRVLLTQQELLPIVEKALPEMPTLECIVVAHASGEGNPRYFPLGGLLKRPAGSKARSFPLIDPKLDLAALPYSSGTAGLSKGVMITHYNLVANTLQSMNAVEARADDVFISFLPFNHIYGFTYFLCGSIYLGARQVVMARFQAEECLRLIQEHRVTVIFGVQPALLAFLNVPDMEKYDLSSLRYIWIGAAPLAPAVAREIRERFGVPIARHYGLSEASPTTHCNPPGCPKDGSVGIAVSDVEDKITDWETGLSEMKPGEPGELALRGPNVFQGYWKHPEDTKLALRNGWLYTGDIAWMDEDGYVFILDRKKEMIKYRGYQIAPAELEAVIMEHPAVQDCAVVGIPEEKLGEIPKAFIVRKDGEKVGAEEIMSFVAERVAPYKKIRDVAFIREIPK